MRPGSVPRALGALVGSTRELGDRVAEIVALADAFLAGVAPPPEATEPAAGRTLEYALADAAVVGPDAAEGLARGAALAGERDAALEWAAARADHGREGSAAAAVISGLAREDGYEGLIEWAAGDDGSAPVQALAVPATIDPGLFVVPRRSFLLARGIERRFRRDYPYLEPALSQPAPFGEQVLFRAETVPALADEQHLSMAMASLTHDGYEKGVLPMSRVPGANVIVLAALLLQELLDPMEVLGWIGRDISALPRRGMPNRPEDVLDLPPPSTGGYMIFSDIHCDAPQDVEFRISHFSANRRMYLRVLRWCERNDYRVIQNGDVIELWSEPTFDPARRQTKLDRLQDILKLHKPVFDRVEKLAQQGRYWQTIGNHDSYLWEDPAVVAWRQANPAFPPLRGGLRIPDCKTMDDLLPHVGLDPDAYQARADMLLLHGHQFDFWNCDEHNRLGKFITNAVGVPADAFDNVIYDFRGVDRLGHPLVELWDLLAPLTPWNNWPPEEVAREWAESLEYRPLGSLITLDSLFFSETFAAVMGLLMRSGPVALENFNPLLCIGHTHNPQSRPWIPYLNRFNPWRDTEILGVRALETLFAWKTRYLNSCTVSWWEHLIWAIQITPEGQPKLVYWASEDHAEPVTMDWELREGPPVPGDPFAGILDWIERYVGDVGVGLEAMREALAGEPPSALAAAPFAAANGMTPGVADVLDLLGQPGTSGAISGDLPLVARAALSATLGGGRGLHDHVSLATLTLAGRQSRGLRGMDPRDWPRQVHRAGTETPSLPPSTALAKSIWPALMTGAPRATRNPLPDLRALVGALFWSYSPRAPVWLGGQSRGVGALAARTAAGTGGALSDAAGGVVRTALGVVRGRGDRRPADVYSETVRLKPAPDDGAVGSLQIRNDIERTMAGPLRSTDWYADDGGVVSADAATFSPAELRLDPREETSVQITVPAPRAFSAGRTHTATLFVEGSPDARMRVSLQLPRARRGGPGASGSRRGSARSSRGRDVQ